MKEPALPLNCRYMETIHTDPKNMNNTDREIIKLHPKKNLPLKLLLLSDETIEAVEKYIYNSDVYIVRQKRSPEPIAVFVLHKISNAQIEIKSIAVLESLQGQGIGSSLLDEIKRIAVADKYKSIIVGTPDTSSRQIHFYEKNGFTKYDVRKDFFIKNYSEPIIENGVLLRDMLMLELKL
jgi:Acetyltransferases